MQSFEKIYRNCDKINESKKKNNNLIKNQMS